MVSTTGTVITGLAVGVAFIFVIAFAVVLKNTPILYATKDNPLGFDARVALVHNFTHPCLQSPCPDWEGLQLKVFHNKPASLLGYAVCNEHFSCIRQEDFSGFGIASLEKHTERPECWGAKGIEQPDWKAGSTVHIWLKVAPEHITYGNTRWVDLGESDILEYNHRQIRETGACN